MHNLIPYFIHQQFEERRYTGSFPAVTMFVDISGFTSMTETFMRAGDEGVEILSGVLNQIFELTVDTIAAYGGFISTFAGDAFTAIFSLEEDSLISRRVMARQALICAIRIGEIFQTYGLLSTKLGDFLLSIRTGLAFGNVDWGIAGDTEKVYFFRGEAVAACVQAECLAGQGQIVVTNLLAELAVRDAEFLFTTSTVDLNPGYMSLEVRLLQADGSPVAPVRPKLRKEVLAYFLPNDVVTFAKPGEFRNVVTVFISFVGISDYAALNKFVSILTANARYFAGYLNKVDFGDKGGVALCLFGAPVAFEDNVRRALDFILAVRQELLSSVARSFNTLQWRAGLTYGVVYAGILGGERRCEYTVIGDHVNLAARLAMKVDFGEVWVTEPVYRQAYKQYDFVPLGEFGFRGIDKRVPVYWLRSRKTTLSQAFRGDFIGRGAEIISVQQPFAAISNRRFGGIVYVYGPAGVGKSRFVYELQCSYTSATWCYLPCDGTLHKSFGPFTRFFAEFFHQYPGNSIAQNRLNFEEIYQKLSDDYRLAHLDAYQDGGPSGGQLSRLKFIMEGFLGLAGEDSAYLKLDSKLRYESTLAVFLKIFKTLSTQKPVIIVLEDFQWIDPDSLAVTESLVTGLQDCPVLFIIVSRYDARENKPTFIFEPSAVSFPVLETTLSPLTPVHTEMLATSLLQGRPSSELLDYLVNKAEGNPFFIEQTLQYFREAGLIALVETLDGGDFAWDIVAPPSTIPATITDLLVARIDRLPEQLERIVQVASVLGHEFKTSLLKHVSERAYQGAPPDITGQLQKGIEEHIWDSLADDTTYVFSNTLFREAVYKMQLWGWRRYLHRLAAEAIKELYPDDARTYFELAFHYEQASLPKEAVDYWMKAAEFAHDAFAIEVAAEYYHKALALLSEGEVDIPRKIALWEGLGNILRLQAKFDESLEVFNQILDVAGEVSDAAAQVRALYGISWVHNSQGYNHAALEKASQAVAVARRADVAECVLIKALVLQGWALCRLGQTDEALVVAEEALSLGQASGNQVTLAGIMNLMSTVYDLLGQYKPAIIYTERALELYRAAGKPVEEGVMLNNLGATLGGAGDYVRAISFFRQALDIAREFGDWNSEMLSLSNLGGMQVGIKDYTSAEHSLRHAIQIAETGGVKFPEPYAYLAEVFLGQGKMDEALAQALAAVDLGLDVQEDLGAAWRALGRVAGALAREVVINGQVMSAVACFSESLTVFTEMGAEAERARTLRVWAEYEQRQGNREAAVRLWARSREIFQQLGMDLELQRMDTGLML